MRTKVTLILIFLNVALFGFIFYVRPKFDIEEKIKATRTRVLGPESADIQSLTLVAGPQTTALARRGEAWSITAPFNWPANPHAVSSILKELQLLEHETSFLVADLPKTGMTLADYGLDHPAASIAFTTTAPPPPSPSSSAKAPPTATASTFSPPTASASTSSTAASPPSSPRPPSNSAPTSS